MARQGASLPQNKKRVRIQTTELCNDDGSENCGSRQALKVGHLLKKPKTEDNEPEQLRATIAADQKELKELIARRSENIEAEQKCHRDGLTVNILEAFRTPNRRTEVATTTFFGTNIASNTVHTSITNVLTASEGLVNEYRRLDGIISDLRKEQIYPNTQTWKQDLEETDKKLRLGARVAMRNVRKVLGAEEDSTQE